MDSTSNGFLTRNETFFSSTMHFLAAFIGTLIQWTKQVFFFLLSYFFNHVMNFSVPISFGSFCYIVLYFIHECPFRNMPFDVVKRILLRTGLCTSRVRCTYFPGGNCLWLCNRCCFIEFWAFTLTHYYLYIFVFTYFIPHSSLHNISFSLCKRFTTLANQPHFYRYKRLTNIDGNFLGPVYTLAALSSASDLPHLLT